MERFTCWAHPPIVQADRGQEEKENKHMSDTIDLLQKYFRRMIISRESLEISKKMGCLFVIVHLFKLYFRVCSTPSAVSARHWTCCLRHCDGTMPACR